ncbi:hypothetical protein M911_09815 [Ectothiorhodospira haloalkaliphila]|uniref:Uncharacterized protein n=1 Tax=Ectothiorhodospira haloalkaliphila TaxID=421628 RepID=W8L699_9GAMM|nr:DUF6746 family protein [Ectothiorhodospira haloalkaliphila]AHK79400.1 hypothetical protein M911_09815 [Ectothiorhodospira haloalkaliphila]
MKKYLMIAALTAGMTLSSGAAWADRVDHFKGKSADTLEQALENFVEYNRKLETALAEGELTPEAVAHIHELTYTLENALERMNQDLADLADTLEEVHLASEVNDVERLREEGRKYLDVANKIAR